MVDYREILRLKSLKYNNTDIAASVHSSRNTVQEVLSIASGRWMMMLPTTCWNPSYIRIGTKRMRNVCFRITHAFIRSSQEKV